MLVLSRKVDEQIVVDGDIVITIVRIDGGGVRIGIEAPKERSIVREELRPFPQRNSAGRKATALVHSA